MASAYIRHLLSKQADNTLSAHDSLTETMKELFTTFFPGKQFLGPQPTDEGGLLFQVRLADGSEHDIDDLSSGEKEVLYGYLRLHDAGPRNSIIMIDEPELHLNPRLINGLASFYNRHLGRARNNQLWLVTHSDTLIREAVASEEFSVFHVQPTASAGGQASRVRGNAEVDGLIIELIGDLAAYRPGAKVVIFESTDDAAFDQKMTCSLFPEFGQRINAISAGDKRRVAGLYELLDKARGSGVLTTQFFAITDADDETESAIAATHLRWDVYHIENYLLEPRFILQSLREVGLSTDRVRDEGAVLEALRSLAIQTIPELLKHKLRVHANSRLVSSIDLGTNPRRSDAAQAIGEAVNRSSARLAQRIRDELGPDKLLALETNWRREYEVALSDGTWIKRFRGRDILKRFAGEFLRGMPYVFFRELILSRMRDAGFAPAGMRHVVETILNA
jgi:hypothetical protein